MRHRQAAGAARHVTDRVCARRVSEVGIVGKCSDSPGVDHDDDNSLHAGAVRVLPRAGTRLAYGVKVWGVMHYRAVVDQFAVTPALDPFSAALFFAAFALAAILTARRAAYGLAALLLSMPFAFYHELAGTTVTLPKVVLLGVLAGLFVHAGAARVLRDPVVRAPLVAIAIYAAAIALSLTGAQFAGVTVREIFKALEYLAVFATAAACYAADPDDDLLVRAVAVIAAAACATALVQELAGAPSGLCVGNVVIPRIAGVIEGPNQLAGFLEVCVAVLGAFAAVRSWRWLRWLLAIAAATVVLTFSRAGIGATAAIALMLVLVQRRRARGALTSLGAGAVAGLAGAAAWATGLHAAGAFRMTLESDCAGEVGSRAQLWRAAWDLWLRRPLFGNGAGNFELLLPQAGVYGVRTHANSWYLQTLAEGGLVWFAATIGMLATLLTSLRRRLAASPWTLAAFAATVALALHQIVDYLVFYTKVGEPWFALLGIGVAAATLPRKPAA